MTEVPSRPTAAEDDTENDKSLKHVEAFTDAACLANSGGAGGYGVVLVHVFDRKELSQGFRRTTNNRMELLAAIVALRALDERCEVTLYSDSEYVVKMLKQGWPKKWKAKGWKLSRGGTVKNQDLWSELVELCDQHVVDFEWVRGHFGHPENERCDRLAVQAAKGPELAVDEGHEHAKPVRAGRRWH